MLTLNKVAAMVATALYVGSGVASTSMVNVNLQQGTEWPSAPSGYAPQPLEEESFTWENQVNKTIKSQHAVFKAEDDIQGVHKYIVQLNDAPLSTYDGGVDNLAATQKTVSQARTASAPLNLNQPTLKAYQSYLAQKRSHVVAQARALQGLELTVGRAYSVALNGFVTEMTQDQAAKLAKVSGVKRITREKIYELKTFSTPAQTGATSVWSGSALNSSNMGEGVVVGIIDTGINTDHPSFAAVGGDGYRHTNPLGSQFLGDCAASPEYCNDKLIGVYSYPEITQAYSDPVFSEMRPVIGEDYNSHGSHVAGTVAGNVIHSQPHVISEYKADGKGVETGLVFPQVSGMAPHANIISYQVCWPGGSGDPYAGCPTSAIIAAIEQSAIDNVDVINASLGSREEDPWTDPIEQAFLNAAASGVFVAVAAGNSGPNIMSADHSSPWLTTVAAHTPDKVAVVTPNGVEQMSGGATEAPLNIEGASKTFTPVTGIMVDAKNFANPNETYASKVKDCDNPFPAGTFDLADDPNTLDIDESQQNVIVLCARSTKPLINKAENVKLGGAEGVVITSLYPSQDTSLPELPYSIPGTLIKSGDGRLLSTWLASGTGHMATISAGSAEIIDVDKERVAYFSGRGPSYFGIDTLFVDIAAPGVDIFAPASDDQPFTSNPTTGEWATLSGTSMASPHVAGAAAVLRQSHPDWTPMQVQSALMMTASNALINAAYFDNYKDYGEKSGLHDMGAGRMRVELADKVGLVLDESMDNMASANPSLGGRAKNLNTAYMVDNDCPSECSFVRTFTAIEDGFWTVDSEVTLGNFDISVQPASFSIKAGETQSLVITATTSHNVSAVASTEYFGNQGLLKLVSDNTSSPMLTLPVWSFAGDSGLPDYLKINAHRKSATLEVGPFNTAEITDFTARSFGLVKGADKTLTLLTDSTASDPFDLVDIDGELVNPNYIEWTDITEGTKLLAGSVAGDDFSRVLVFMGQDSDGDGVPSMEETLCMSTDYTISNFCTIINPQEGRYFTVYMNLARLSSGQVDQGRDITISTAVVNGDNGNLMVKAPTQIPGYSEYNLEMTYNLPEMEVGNTYFGGFDIGSNANDAGNLGFVPVIINQVNKDVNFTSNRAVAIPGDVVEFEVNVIANNEANARDFALNVNFPDGVQIIPDSIVASNATPGAPVLENNSMMLSGVQETTKNVVREYKITNNQNDPMCSLTVAKSPYPGYLELRENLGWKTLEGVQGAYYNEFQYRIKDLMQSDEDITFPFFNKYHVDTIKLNPAGVVTFNSTRRVPHTHVEFPTSSSTLPLPEYMIAPFWTADNTIPKRFDGGYGQYHLNAGITPTYTVARDWLVLEWDNVERANTPGQLVDFEMFLRMNINYEPGGYEMMFAYDNLQLVDDKGSIGFKAVDGRIIVDGDTPKDINLGASAAYNNLSELIDDKFVLCMDYNGPEQSQFNVKFNAYVSEKAAGTTQTLMVENHLVGADSEVLELQLAVAGNIQLAEFADKTVAENESISFEVFYSDENQTSNVIEVSGEHFTSTVSGNASGSTVTLTPSTDYYGETIVTVMVKDGVNPGDATSGRFNLIVESDGIEFGCTDANATNYDESANTDDGSCTMPIAELPSDETSSGGALGWLALVLLPLTFRRNKRSH